MESENRVILFLRQIVYPQYQIVMICITTSLALLIGYQFANKFHSLDPESTMYSVTPQKIREWGTQPTEVSVGLHIINFPIFDIVKNNFVFDGIVWFEFDPALIALETIAKFSFEKGDILKISEPDTKLINGKFFARYNIRVQFTSNLDYKLFPFDDHRLNIVLVNKFVSPSEVMFESYDAGFTMQEGIFIPGWYVVSEGVRTGYAQAQLEVYDPSKMVLNPKVVFEIDFERSGAQQILLIFLPLFLIFFTGLFSFGFDPEKSTNLVWTLASASVASMISYRFVIQNMSPTIGYFTFSDIVFTLFLAFSFAGFLFNIILVYWGKFTGSMATLRGCIFLLFHITFLASWYYLLTYWA